VGIRAYYARITERMAYIKNPKRLPEKEIKLARRRLSEVQRQNKG